MEYAITLGRPPLTRLTKEEAKETGARWKLGPPGPTAYSYPLFKNIKEYQFSLRCSAAHAFHHEKVMQRFYEDLPNIPSDELEALLVWLMLSLKLYTPGSLKWKELGYNRGIRAWIVESLVRSNKALTLPQNWRTKLPPVYRSFQARRTTGLVVTLSRAIPTEMDERIQRLPAAQTTRSQKRL